MKTRNYRLVSLNKGGYALKGPNGMEVDLKKHGVDLTGYELDEEESGEKKNGTLVYRFIGPYGNFYALTVYPNGSPVGTPHAAKKGKSKPGDFPVIIPTESGYLLFEEIKQRKSGK